MSAQGIAATVVWTQLLAALKTDFPDIQLPTQTGPETTKAIREIVAVAVPAGKEAIQQEHIKRLEAKLCDVDQGLDVAERMLAVAVQGKHEDAPFPLDENEAKLWHRAQASAYRHALEMCNSTSLKAFIENGFKPVTNAEPVPKAKTPKGASARM